MIITMMNKDIPKYILSVSLDFFISGIFINFQLCSASSTWCSCATSGSSPTGSTPAPSWTRGYPKSTWEPGPSLWSGHSLWSGRDSWSVSWPACCGSCWPRYSDSSCWVPFWRDQGLFYYLRLRFGARMNRSLYDTRSKNTEKVFKKPIIAEAKLRKYMIEISWHLVWAFFRLPIPVLNSET